ncbi:MAG: 50S ribosomal protein L19 [Candidatus Levybacteria bacterium]|nr:50S ribosomal protein L19 [Candidatus Levybacteria bacterium]
MISQIDFVVGDTVRVFQKVTEGEKTRTQVFEGVVLGIKGRGENKTFTVRKLVGDIAVERIFPMLSPNIEKVVVKAHSKKKIRRAKLYYLRNSTPR